MWVSAGPTGDWGWAGVPWLWDDAEQVDDLELEQLVAASAQALCDNAWPDDWTERWPLCPAHGGHSLEPVERRGKALWVCPVEGRPTVPIGELPAG